MKKILLWLAAIEKRAADLYGQGAKAFECDRELSHFLMLMADDEKLHHLLVLKACEALSSEDDMEPLVSVDSASMLKVQASFAELEEKIQNKRLSKEDLLKNIVHMEFSELNGIFLYAIDVLKDRFPDEVSFAADNIEQHKERIREYLEQRTNLRDLLGSVKSLPSLKKEKVLIIESKAVNANILKAVLENEVRVDCVDDAGKALEKIETERFSAIIVNMDTPRLNAMELYAKIISIDPGLKGSFIFLAAANNSEHIPLLRKSNLRYLRKPAPISEIQSKVRELLGA